MKAEKQQLTKAKEDFWSKENEWEMQATAQQDSMDVGDSILKEANAILQNAMKNKDFKEVSFAQAIIEAVQKRISNANAVMQQAREKQRSVSKRKQVILNKHLFVRAQQAKIFLLTEVHKIKSVQCATTGTCVSVQFS